MNKGILITLIISAALHIGFLALPQGRATSFPPPAEIMSITINTTTAANSESHPESRDHQRDRRAAPELPASPSGEMLALMDRASPVNVTGSAPQAVASASPQDTLSDATTAAPASLSDHISLESRLSLRLQGVLAAYFNYPLLARRQGWSGQVQVSLRVEPDGSLSHLRLYESSGYHILDKAALNSLGRVGLLPGAADWLGGNYFDIVLPIEYRLTDLQS